MGWSCQRWGNFWPETLNSQSFPSRNTKHASRLRAITFDVGGTLIQPWPSVGHIYAEVAARHGIHNIPVESLDRQFANSWKNLRDFNYTSLEWHSLVNQTFQGLTQVPVSDNLFSDLYARFA